MFAKAMLETWAEGDKDGNLFAFPKANITINDDTFSDESNRKGFMQVCDMASMNGLPYFCFMKDGTSVSQCCRLTEKITDTYMLEHPESLRFTGFANITINLPQCAYKAGPGNPERLLSEIDKVLEICVKAHLQKKAFIRNLMSGPAMPLWQIGKPCMDGRPYVDLEKATYIIGILGLNECVQFIYGKELHENDMLKEGVRIIAYLYTRVKDIGKKYGLKFSIEESPAESATRRLAKIDLRNYPSEAIVQGQDGEIYYSNSIHYRASAPISLIERIKGQSKYHGFIESGAIIHSFVGERRPSPESIARLVESTFKHTQCKQLTISPEFTVCAVCGKQTSGFKDTCKACGAKNVEGVERISVEELQKVLN
jgi:ribonucleoside-triphosphate reductase